MSEPDNIHFIGILDSIYAKLDEKERSALVALTQKAARTRESADQLQAQLLQTQMFLAVIVKEHGVRTSDDSRAILKLHKDAFGRLKGDLESWEEPSHMVLSYTDDATAREEPEGPGGHTPAGSVERTPN